MVLNSGTINLPTPERSACGSLNCPKPPLVSRKRPSNHHQHFELSPPSEKFLRSRFSGDHAIEKLSLCSETRILAGSDCPLLVLADPMHDELREPSLHGLQPPGHAVDEHVHDNTPSYIASNSSGFRQSRLSHYARLASHESSPPPSPKRARMGADQDPEQQPVKAMDFGLPRFKPSYMAESEPHTPVEQMPMPGNGPYDSHARFGSVSSIATTDDDEGLNEIVYPWTPQQDELVRTAYEEHVNAPQTTPFSGRYPPSGVLHRVAKNTLKLAKHNNITFPHSMNAVRHRMLILYDSGPTESAEELDKYKMQDYFSIVPNHYQRPQPQPQPQLQQPLFDEFEFSDAISSSRRLSVEEKYAGRSRMGSIPGQGLGTGLASSTGPGLAAPFRESKPLLPAVNTTMGPNQGPSQGLTEEDVVNIVAKRKRDSLRMKRGQI